MSKYETSHSLASFKQGTTDLGTLMNDALVAAYAPPQRTPQ